MCYIFIRNISKFQEKRFINNYLITTYWFWARCFWPGSGTGYNFYLQPTEHILCYVFIFLRLCFQFILIVHLWLPLRYFLTFVSNVTLRAVFELSNSSVQKDNFDTPQSSQVRLRHEAFGDVLSHTVTSYISFMCSNTGYVSLSKSELPEDKFFLPNSIHLKKIERTPMCYRQQQIVRSFCFTT
jgi:hypothetical protein